MYRVYKAFNKYYKLPIKVMYKLRDLKCIEKNYDIEPYKDKIICWYYVPRWYSGFWSINWLVNIVIADMTYDYIEDDDWETEEYRYYSDDYIVPKNREKNTPLYRLQKWLVKDIKVVDYFPWELEDSVYEEDKVYGWHWERFTDYDLDCLDNMYYY
jgi:hypothetical protein